MKESAEKIAFGPTGVCQRPTKSRLTRSQPQLFCSLVLGIGFSFGLASAKAVSADPARANTLPAVPWAELGAKAAKGYQGEGLTISATAEGTRLRCVFQRLEGESTREGLWLTSTVTNRANDRFRVIAVALGRQSSREAIARTGTVAVEAQTVRFMRPGLVEDYSVSMDGVRQDFVVLERPGGAGDLAVELAVSGAEVESVGGGAQLVLENSRRKLSYNRLSATDAAGKELSARMEVPEGNPESKKRKVEITINDAEAVYPVRIDPTFSDANWISMGGIPGANSTVRAAVADGWGNLYIGGDFSVVGDLIANHIAKWDGSSWSALGSGVFGCSDPHCNNSSVYALAVRGSDLYVGGTFTNAGGVAANYIAKWNGSSWSALGSGMSGATFYPHEPSVFALAVSGNDLYAGGDFLYAGGNPTYHIAKWSGSSWSALGSGMSGGLPYPYSPSVFALAVSGTNLYVGGYFGTAGGGGAVNIAKWDGSGWTALGSGIDGILYGIPSVYALAVSGSDLYVGGVFTNAGGAAATSIARWDGSSWSALDPGVLGGTSPLSVYALAVSGGEVHVGGFFTTAGGNEANYIAKWDGTSWSTLGSGMAGGATTVYALAVSGGDLYAGGNFYAAEGNEADCIAKWDGNNWSALGSGMGSDGWGSEGLYGPQVSAVTVLGRDVYAGGTFTMVGGSAADRIAKWNGTSWSALGSGLGSSDPSLPPYVSALAVSGSDLYAGGYFFTAGGVAAANIAKWNGNTWSALGSGLDGPVSALAASGSDLYASGTFTFKIAKWNGSSWSALGSGITAPSGYPYYGGSVAALVVSGSDLYAGGMFTNAGGQAAYSIAKWDGTSWSGLDGGVAGLYPSPYSGSVYALAVSGSDLYLGGRFDFAGGTFANGIVKWDGTNWTALGSGVQAGGTVYALAVSGSNLYVGGVFTNGGGSAANFVAKWNGSSWSALGSGISRNPPNNVYSHVYALAVSGSDLYVGGDFTTAGDKASAYVARAIVNPPVLAIEPDGFGGYFLRFSGVPGSDYRLQRAPGLAGPWATSSPQTAPASGFLEFWDLFPPPGQAFYRSVGP